MMRERHESNQPGWRRHSVVALHLFTGQLCEFCGMCLPCPIVDAGKYKCGCKLAATLPIALLGRPLEPLNAEAWRNSRLGGSKTSARYPLLVDAMGPAYPVPLFKQNPLRTAARVNSSGDEAVQRSQYDTWGMTKVTPHR